MARVFCGLIAYKDEVVHLSRAGVGTERTWVHAVSGNYFDVLGVKPFLGRLFLREEGRRPGADAVVVLTYDTWRRRFASDPGMIGQAVKLNGVSFTTIGVTPPGFFGAAWGTALSGFVPATMLPQLSLAHGGMIFERGNTGFFMMGRLRPGVTVAQAQAASELLMARGAARNRDPQLAGVKPLVLREAMSRPSPFVASFVPLVLSVLMVLALLVLAVAAANVANLLFARAASRQHELAVRGALGASRWQLLRPLLAESALLALAATALGLLATLSITPLLARIGPGGDFAPGTYAGVDWRLFVFAFGVALATGVLTALYPALQATRLSLVPQLKEGARTAAPARHAFRSLLVATQIAVSCVVLTAMGLALRSLDGLSRVELGFDPGHLLIATYDLGLQRYEVEAGRRFHARLLERVRLLPSVREASVTGFVPFEPGSGLSGVAAEGQPTEDGLLAAAIAADHSFLRTIGMPVVEGRDFVSRDDGTAAPAAIINRALARRLWPEGSAVGRRLSFQGRRLDVVGVVGNPRFWALTDEGRPLVFRPLAQEYRGKVALVVRTMGPPENLLPAIREVFRGLDADLPLHDVRTMEQQIARSPLGLMPLRVGSGIAGAQGAIALLLSALGVFGLVSFATTRRTREIGIRVAMGASALDVTQLVVAQGLKLTAIGVGCGLLASLALGRILTRLLYGIGSTDLRVFAAVVALMLAITVLACWLPARRAVRIDPSTTLRWE
jgi:predicted permease